MKETPAANRSSVAVHASSARSEGVKCELEQMNLRSITTFTTACDQIRNLHITIIVFFLTGCPLSQDLHGRRNLGEEEGLVRSQGEFLVNLALALINKEGGKKGA